ncbi:hypothetical protein PBCVNY2B_559R [Paramecium bursaria Chlorella virus NY2B]|uniref:Uncharacterized protein n=1 Tax=Paramecium bursaria Chlorella virus NYs1 TaxID=83442 RepID=M1IJV2_9PHYC|nr:hypothetical protein AR158_C493R [Paramecium bursaria Chlorella virus AR158]YP_009665430.1 hypothetical protein FK949_gp340 [Paramecium bursaria Chlorella virus NYs1]AGE54285.1 hypothetical protein PBCVIL52s1_577R [Paramecium bursaria Chlorella virus IL-5-2s1]AGE54926.1 hypothetical protein PBCVMA1D_444R [Paramecium bursaria Chlorella virus MA1D]AGE58401.1 hypothetical protein PBCVNY2B_559R [Paramecium bursaria Chlorella virus NY2B]ABU44038.1 hypothetical protein AR158_C493R [Paramecium bur
MGYTEIIELPQDDVKKNILKPAVKSVAKSVVEARPDRPSIYLAVPCYGCLMMNTFAASIIALQALCAQRGIQIYMDFVGNESLIERARNILVKRFLQSSGFTHFMFIDADIGFNPESVIRLLEFDKDVTSAVYPKKSINWEHVKQKIAAESQEDIRQMGLDFNINLTTPQSPINGFVKVLDVATGFLMMKREVLERMYKHYEKELYAVNDIQGQDVKDYIAIFACMIDPETKRFLSEDYAFCRRYQQMGGDIWADISIPLSHSGTHVYSGDIRERFTM